MTNEMKEMLSSIGIQIFAKPSKGQDPFCYVETNRLTESSNLAIHNNEKKFIRMCRSSKEHALDVKARKHHPIEDEDERHHPRSILKDLRSIGRMAGMDENVTEGKDETLKQFGD
ncbi:hypothetical protein P7K49_027423 [Saguinus oedipus]|uniref:Uncharacterized protein n=1 Tax=Saguinus oedipus TaxID=9490 RepID=A0ABQ9UA85_SAGOE|nr:hypothetical protein P7K49_027423 [Saguinus oedipus]